MSVLIKGMDMPENCFQCPCVDGEYGVCQAVDSYEIGSMKFRPPFCPLVEVPTPHGRLIDGDNLMRLAYNYKDRTVDCNDIARVSTVIKAED